MQNQTPDMPALGTVTSGSQVQFSKPRANLPFHAIMIKEAYCLGVSCQVSVS